jgi:hypothetical protein
MPVLSSRVTVAATPTIIVNPVRGADLLPDNTYAMVKNAGGVSIFLGGVTVTAAAGFELGPGTAISLELIIGDVLYGITAAGTVEAHVMKLRQ